MWFICLCTADHKTIVISLTWGRGPKAYKWKLFSPAFCLTVMKNDSIPTVGHTGKFITCLISHPGRPGLNSYSWHRQNGNREQCAAYSMLARALFNWLVFNKHDYEWMIMQFHTAFLILHRSIEIQKMWKENGEKRMSDLIGRGRRTVDFS